MKNLIPGIELDTLVALRVMGWKRENKWLINSEGQRWEINSEGALRMMIPPYSVDIRAAWEILTCGKWTWSLEEMDDEGRVECYFENEDDDIWARSVQDTAPHAICLAALEAIEQKST